MTRIEKKIAIYPSSTSLTRHTNNRALRKRMNRRDRQRLNKFLLENA